MRWSYLIPRFIILGIIWGFMTYGLDPALRYTATQTLQAMTGAKADIGVFETGFFPPRVTINSVALASRGKPGTNLVEFDKMHLSIAGAPLLRKSYVIDEALVTGVRFGTSRNDNGQLEHVPASDEPTIPPWISDKLKSISDEWLDDFTEQAKAQLDPNNLESYRVGNELYVKWDARFQDMNVRVKTSREELELLKQQMEQAKSGDALQQIEKYLQLAQRADLMLRSTRSLLEQFKNSVPLEVKQDFARLDQAQKNDRAMVGDTINSLKPDARMITESLIGEEMYVQLQQMLTWLEILRSYQDELKQPPAPERYRGRDFEFDILNPTPRVLCRKMLLNGELMLGKTPTPFEASLTDVTSDPKLLGRPAVMNVATAGTTPIQVVVQHDATLDIATTRLAADFVDNNVQHLSAGKADKHQLTASLSNLRWKARVLLVEDTIQGEISVVSDFGSPEFHTTQKSVARLVGLTEQTLSGISSVNATLTMFGPIKHPEVRVTSDLGDQFAAGFETALKSFLPQMKAELITMLDGYVDRQKQELSAKLGGRYTELLADNQKLLDGLTQARQLAMDLKSGHVDPNAVFKQVSQSGVLSDKDQQKANKVMGQTNKVLDGLNDPNKAIIDSLPGLRKKLFR